MLLCRAQLSEAIAFVDYLKTCQMLLMPVSLSFLLQHLQLNATEACFQDVHLSYLRLSFLRQHLLGDAMARCSSTAHLSHLRLSFLLRLLQLAAI